MKNAFGTSLLVVAVASATGFTSAAMAQDECSTAGTVTAGTPVAFNTATATPSADPAPNDAQCAGTFLDWGTNNKDVWFRYTPTEDGLASFSTCASGSFDTSMVLYTGTCGSLTQVACNGDGAGESGCQAFYSRIADFSVTGGTTYYVRIGGWNGAESGTGTLSVSFAAAGGCTGATGDCAEPHGGLGCSDATCCSAVCAFDFICCEIGWDESCVGYAVELCGIFIYECDQPNGAVSNDCAPNASIVSGDTSRTFNITGCNTDGPDHPAGNCNSGNDFFLYDIWYRGQAQANGTLRVNTCNNTTFDSKLAVYNMGTNPAAFDFNTLPDVLVGCNDDGDSACQTNATYASDLSVTVTVGNWYLVRVASYDNPGSGTVFFDFPEPCSLATATVTETEDCGQDTNGGCNAGGVTQPITTSDVVAGTFWKDSTGRDTDFYSLTVTEEASYTFSVRSANFAQLLVMGGDITAADCAGITILSTGTGSCPTSATACLPVGTYYVFVGIPFSAADTACGSGALNQYTLQVSSAPADCPELIDGVCDVVGPNTATINTSTATGNGLVRCASQPAYPNCATGGSGRNRYARSFNAGAATGSITCLNFGVWSTRRNVNGTACGLFLSDLPLPTTIGIYKDLDGGDPRNVIETAGDGNDLELIESRSVLIPGVAGIMTINFDPPLCLEGTEGSKLVVVADFPDLIAGTGGIPGNAGYQLLAGGNTVDGSSATFIRLSCADAAGAFVPAESLGATFTARWVVALNGDFSGCEAPCPGDFNGDGFVTAADLSTLLGAWGTPAGDIDGDGTTSASDLSALLGGWGQCQ